MGSLSIWHWLIVLAVVLILFGGGGKISKLMGDFGRGLKSFKKNLKEDEGAETAEGGEAKKAVESQAQPAPGQAYTQAQPQQPAQAGPGAAPTPPASGNTRPS